MGNEDSVQRARVIEYTYEVSAVRQHAYFGPHRLLTKKNNPNEALICKQFIFGSKEECQ
jgi:hypothetical protein